MGEKLRSAPRRSTARHFLASGTRLYSRAFWSSGVSGADVSVGAPLCPKVCRPQRGRRGFWIGPCLCRSANQAPTRVVLFVQLMTVRRSHHKVFFFVQLTVN